MKKRRTYNNKIVLFLAVTFLLLLNYSSVSASEITEGVKETIDAVIEVVSNEELKKDDKRVERRAQLQKILSKKFNYQEMSRRTLAHYWKKRTAEEKKEFIDLFGKFFEKSYAEKIENYNGEKTMFIKERVRNNIALVKTIIYQGNDKIRVDYKLINHGNDWKIYDFIVEGVSLIKNYRTEFNKIIRKTSYQELINKLKDKVEGFSNNNANKA